jgi:predicted double-glycine peptidase
MKIKEITFTEKKENHFYAVKNEKGQYVLVQDPKPGDRVFEFAAVAGG